MMKISIIVIGYNRPESLERCLKYISKAKYPISVDLHISIDKTKNPSDLQKNCDCINLSRAFEWKYGSKFLHIRSKNMGLRRHILTCGDLSVDYDAIIMLEDDIVVSESFFDFAIQALDFYNDDEDVAGISLYSHHKNFQSGENFWPIDSGSDIYHLQVASSWGQVWSREHWTKFRVWLENNSDDIDRILENCLPPRINSWPNSSWLKIFIGYMIVNNKYFIYPYLSLTTNWCDSGTHNKLKNTDYQVRIQYSNKGKYKFLHVKDCISVYNSYFECVSLIPYLSNNFNVTASDISVDFYGNIPDVFVRKYHLTTKKKNARIIASYALDFKPYELNIFLDNQGKDLYFYDLSVRVNNSFNKTYHRMHYLEYIPKTSDLVKRIIKRFLRG